MSTYDVIVVGAGAAGAPLAARLSDDPDLKVLLLEAGPDYIDGEGFPPELLEYYNMQGSAPGHPNNWSFVANLTPDLPYSMARGKIMGGSTSVNGTYWVRGRKEDFDRYVSMGNDAWSFDAVLPVYKRLERDLTFDDPEIHNQRGPVPVYRAKRGLHQLSKAFNEASAELGFPEDPDKNDHRAVPGYGPIPLNVEENIRINTGFAFIDPIRDRPNLTVLGDTYVRRVVLDGTTVAGVEVERDGRVEVIDGREVILAAGAVKSPHLLMMSGVGPRAELEKFGVDVVVDSPGVGKNFTDHPDIGVGYRATRKAKWTVGGDGMQVMLNFVATDSPFPGAGDLEIIHSVKPFGVFFLGATMTNLKNIIEVLKRPLATLRGLKGVSLKRLAQQVAHRNDFALLVAVQQPVGRGQISLKSGDPSVQPQIDYHYLELEEDRRRMREVIRTAVQLLQTKAYRPYVKRITELSPETLADDRKLDAWMRTHLATAIHASSSCHMGPDSDPLAVTDQFGRVRGVVGLRVADTSILPTVVSRGPACTAMMLGTRIGDFVLEERGFLGVARAESNLPADRSGAARG